MRLSRVFFVTGLQVGGTTDAPEFQHVDFWPVKMAILKPVTLVQIEGNDTALSVSSFY